MSKLKKVIPVVTTTTTTMVTPKSRYSTFTGYAEHPWSGNNPNPQKPDNEPIKKRELFKKYTYTFVEQITHFFFLITGAIKTNVLQMHCVHLF